MKKTFLIFAFMLVLLSLFEIIPNSENFSMALEPQQEAFVIASRCKIYSEASFSSAPIELEIEGQIQPLFLKHDDKVLVIEIEGDFAKIKTKDIEKGFVYKYYLTQNKSQDIFPVYNATIRNDCVLYDLDYQNSGYSLAKDSRVFVYKKFNEKEEFTAVQVLLENNILFNGFVKTKDVQPDGISGLLIAGISIIAAAVTIILSIVFMKKKKKRKEKRKKNKD